MCDRMRMSPVAIVSDIIANSRKFTSKLAGMVIGSINIAPIKYHVSVWPSSLEGEMRLFYAFSGSKSIEKQRHVKEMYSLLRWPMCENGLALGGHLPIRRQAGDDGAKEKPSPIMSYSSGREAVDQAHLFGGGDRASGEVVWCARYHLNISFR